jgi:hypothetical protein
MGNVSPYAFTAACFIAIIAFLADFKMNAFQVIHQGLTISTG